jgi:PKD domain
VRPLLAVAAFLVAALAAAPAHAAFEPGDDVTYTAGGSTRTGVVMVKAGPKDLYLVSRDGAESTQYVLPGSRLALRDRDGDGVPDNRDSCPTQPGTGVDGCPPPPDGDGDGVADASDVCPTLRGGAPDGCPAPTPAYGFSPTGPQVGHQVTFDGSATGCHSRPCTYTWDDVTGGSVLPLGTGQTLTHTFGNAGTRSVRLIARDAHGRVGSVTRDLTIAAPPPPPPPPAGTVTLRQVDGGPGYYDQFANGFPSDPGFFPIGVWFESVVDQGNIDKDKAAGLNTYVRLTGDSSLSLVRSNGMHAIITSGHTGVGSETKGWLTEDEPDMWAGPGSDPWTGTWTGPVCNPPVTQGGQCGYTVLETINNRLPADGRARYSNYGKGVLVWETDAQAARFLNGTPSFGPYQHIVSSDLYFFTDGDVCIASQGGRLLGVNRDLTQAECRRASNYGLVIDRQRALMQPKRPVWGFVEVGHPGNQSWAPSITPPQIRAAVWHSLIAGARGIIYFNHSFGGPCISHHALREPCYAAARQVVTDTNAQIKQLAPVLNAPSVDQLVASSPGVRTMAKWQGGKFYVFAGNGGAGAVSTTFDLPCVGNVTATVVDEGRQVPVVNGKFSDQFADGNAIHIYRIDGGSTCGLTP